MPASRSVTPPAGRVAAVHDAARLALTDVIGVIPPSASELDEFACRSGRERRAMRRNRAIIQAERDGLCA